MDWIMSLGSDDWLVILCIAAIIGIFVFAYLGERLNRKSGGKKR
jgi:hypothetical protein